MSFITSTKLRYGKSFSTLRQFVKHGLSLMYPVFKLIFRFPKVVSVFETLEKLKSNTFSIIRFGDSEILYLNDHLNLPYQKYDSRLAKSYEQILKNNKEKLLVGLPIGYQDINTLSKEGQIFWRSQVVWNYPRFKKYLNLNSIYENASVTRLTYGFDKTYTEKAFGMWSEILQGENVLIVEGEKTRFGVGNDLLKGFREIKRIIAPKHNAFERCDEIIEYIVNNQVQHELILVALGTAAKYLIFELFKKGYRCIDVGNLDIEYEWYLRGGYNERTIIPGKYTSEVKGGREVGDHPDKIAFEQYKSEIIALFT
jgi:glycosyltransferase family protein